MPRGFELLTSPAPARGTTQLPNRAMRFALLLALAGRAACAPLAESSTILNRVVAAADDDAVDESAFNANWNSPHSPLDYCLRGMPENVWGIDDEASAKTYDEAHERLAYWTELARDALAMLRPKVASTPPRLATQSSRWTRPVAWM